MKKLLLFIFFASFAFAAHEKYARQYEIVSNISTNADDLKAKLEAEIQKMINAGNELRPAFYCPGITEEFLLFGYPGETVYTLCRAYNYLSPALRAQVYSYLTNEIKRLPFLEIGFMHRYTGSRWAGWGNDYLTGNRREFFEPNTNFPLNIWPKILVPPQALYIAWLYSYTFNDTEYISNNWSKITEIYNDITNVTGYCDLAGLIGMARLADIYGDTAIKADAMSKLSTEISASSFSNYYETAWLSMRQQIGQGTHSWGIPVFNSTLQKKAIVTFCAPEIGRIINELHKDELTNFLYQFIGNTPNEHVYKTMPGWSAFRADYQPYWEWNLRVGLFADYDNVDNRTHGGENTYLTPDIHFTLFMFRKYVYEDSGKELEKCVDYPTCIADLYHIQKLIAAIEAFGNSSWADLWDTPLRIIQPNGGENIIANSDFQIVWESTNSISNVDLFFSDDNFVSDIYTITTSYANSGTYNWSAPELYSETLKIKIADSTDSNVYDISDADFAITPEPSCLILLFLFIFKHRFTQPF